MSRGAVSARRHVSAAVGVSMAVVVYFAVRVVLDDMAARALAIFVVAAVFWTAEVLPLFATALLVVVLEVMFLATEGGFSDHITRLLGPTPAIRAGSPNVVPISAREFIQPFASDIIRLFLGGFLLAAAVARHGVDAALAGRVLRPFTTSPLSLIYGLAGLSAFFSMWMSNTATAAMMVALAGPILRSIPTDERYRSAVLLAIAFGANVGGIGTPIGTPPNAIVYGTGQIARADMVRAGAIVSATALTLTLLGYRFVLPLPF